ncbi:MAG: PAS domain-containing protein [Myxococcales bacterium]|nr:PAS domain-containing protein [Myxococcales bacterium]MDH5306320.1 PAS domain-containing protein [Myxococcales bacterium]MDH5565983.1 PAS domain-containing protein [Myxococcales bacterium]
MSAKEPRSLMDFIAAPVLVGDPDGRVVYVNPAFESEFHVTRSDVRGVPLAGLFEGGAREAMLDAVARVFGGSTPSRFRIRESGSGYLALASPVEADEGRVGVVILLTVEASVEDRLLTFRREILEPLDDLASCLAEISEQTGGRRGDKFRLLIADGVRALARMRKWAESIAADLRSNP